MYTSELIYIFVMFLHNVCSCLTFVPPFKPFILRYLSGLSLQMPRAQRFPDSFHQALQSLVLSVMPHITIRPMEIPEEARCINLSLANLIKVGTSA